MGDGPPARVEVLRGDEHAPSLSTIKGSRSCGSRSSREFFRRRSQEIGSLRVVSLNLGGRNTNPLEFQLKGDTSDTAVEAVAILSRAEKALLNGSHGPASALATERTLIEDILAEIYGGCGSSTEAVDSESRTDLLRLFKLETWSMVLSHVKAMQPYLFNALNLSTLKLQRPSVWEDPTSCKEFKTSEDYLLAWQRWYSGLDRSSQFWLEDAPRTARKRNLDVATAFAGLLVFDLMCLCTARCARKADCEYAASEDNREVPFEYISTFASRLPASSFEARHQVAKSFVERTGAHVLLAQEARNFADHPSIVEDFMPPFRALDGFTAVFLRKDAFAKATDISASVSKRMEDLVDAEDQSQARHKPWRTSATRLAAVHCQCHPTIGGFQVCFVSLHCSKSEFTADFLEVLRDVLADYPADINMVGLDSNCSGKEAADFQRRLWNSGFEIGCSPQQDQVTVVKQRTFFQTQVRKAGETDISHKDYVVSWGSSRIRRRGTSYTPDVRTAYGVEQETRLCVRLPTTRWPFDHCGVATSFVVRRSRLRTLFFSRKALFRWAVVLSTLVLMLLPLASHSRKSPLGKPGTWHQEGFIGTPRVGICEVPAPCPRGWIARQGSCYTVTPQLGFDDAEEICRRRNSFLVAIGTEAENTLATKMCPEGDVCWIGLRGRSSHADHAEEWYWDSGEPLELSMLVPTPKIGLPLFPLSQDDRDLSVVVSNLPGEISRCHPDFMLNGSGRDRPLLLPLILFIPGFALALSALILVWPRPRHLWTTLYLALAFASNLLWFLLRMLGSCFFTDPTNLKVVVLFDPHLLSGGHMVTSMLGFWIVFKRMRLLYGGRSLRVIFNALVTCAWLWLVNTFLFVDTTKSAHPMSFPVLVASPLSALMSVLYLTFGALLAWNLYQTWTFMKREAASGLSQKGGTILSNGVRAARLHFLIVFTTIITGAIYWSTALMVVLVSTQNDAYPLMWKYTTSFAKGVDSVIMCLCAHLLAVLNMDQAVMCAKRISAEVAKRARLEVEQHRLAVQVLKAAPTSQEQLRYLAQLEGATRSSLESQDEEAFLILQSVVRAESARIHRLMMCVRFRAMTMGLRYQYLIDTPILQGTPRQYVPPQFAGGGHAEAAAYFDWLYSEADGVQVLLFQQVRQLVKKFNQTPWPSDLGLPREQFPWMIWANGLDGNNPAKRLQCVEAVNPGDILIHSRAMNIADRLFGRNSSSHCLVLEEQKSNRVRIHRCGRRSAEEVPREELLSCVGGGVFIPGPKKKKQRCLDKIATDYAGGESWPAAASLLDICRCMILLDDPYEVAVLVAFICSSMHVVRIKNRFSEDVLESISPEDLQSMFYTAADMSDVSSASTAHGGDHQYRDIAINVSVLSPNGVPFICEIQVTLSSLAILKMADQKLYTVRRMKNREELRTTIVFSEASRRSMDVGNWTPASAHSTGIWGAAPSSNSSHLWAPAQSGNSGLFPWTPAVSSNSGHINLTLPTPPQGLVPALLPQILAEAPAAAAAASPPQGGRGGGRSSGVSLSSES